MRISLAESQTTGFKKWSDAHPVEPDAKSLTVAEACDIPTSTALRGGHRPWMVPGVGRL